MRDMTDYAARVRDAEEAVLEAADMLPDLVDGLEELCDARRRTFRAEQVLEEDLAAIELVKDQLDEKGARVKERRKDADKATRELERLAQDLGAAAFAAREVGDLPDLSIFNERQAAQREVDDYEGQITELSEAKGFGRGRHDVMSIRAFRRPGGRGNCKTPRPMKVRRGGSRRSLL